jgi:hypothetical protein
MGIMKTILKYISIAVFMAGCGGEVSSLEKKVEINEDLKRPLICLNDEIASIGNENIGHYKICAEHSISYIEDVVGLYDGGITAVIFPPDEDCPQNPPCSLGGFMILDEQGKLRRGMGPYENTLVTHPQLFWEALVDADTDYDGLVSDWEASRLLGRVANSLGEDLQPDHNYVGE